MFAYPHLPVGNDAAWTNQVPLVAHHVSTPALATGTAGAYVECRMNI